MNLRFTSYDGTRHAREFLDTTVYHKNSILTSSIFAPTADLEYAEYFLRNIAGAYVSLAALEPSYSTPLEDIELLHNLQEQYTPEVLI